VRARRARQTAQGEGAFAAQIIRHVQPAAQAKIAAHTVTANIAHAQRHPGTHRKDALFPALTVQRQVYFCPGHDQLRVAVEFQRRAAEGDFQRGSAIIIAQQAVAQTQARLSIGPDGGTPTAQ
jgi:hypothetical protein